MAVFLIWGGGTTVVFTIVFLRRMRNFRRHRHDRRQAVRRDVRRDVVSGFALMLTAVGATLATAFILFGAAGSGPRSFMIALALGAFTGAGFVMASEEDTDARA